MAKKKTTLEDLAELFGWFDARRILAQKKKKKEK